jgi:hypothetical protein
MLHYFCTPSIHKRIFDIILWIEVVEQEDIRYTTPIYIFIRI